MNPKLVKVTSDADGVFVNRMYSYWSSACVLDGSIVVFAGRRDGPPLFYRVGFDGSVSNLGSLVPYAGEAEGWYWDARGRVYLTDGPRLRRVSPFTQQDEIVFDILATHPDCRVWQAHSSEDGRVHCATVQRIVSEGSYPNISTVVATSDRQVFYPASGNIDESIVDASGRYVLIQESGNNRIIEGSAGDERFIADASGAIAHVDCGDGFAVGEADKPEPGQCAYLDLSSLAWRPLFHTRRMGHVSVKGGRCLHADKTALSLVDLETGAETWLLNHGMVGEGYDYQCHANLSPDGRVAAFVSNMGSERFDVYLLIL